LTAEGEKAKAESQFANRRALYVEAGGKTKNVSRDVEFLTKQISDIMTFEAVLETYKTENPELFKAEKTEVISTTLDVKGGPKPTSEERAEVNRIREAQKLPPLTD
jgi:hypothetical protein